MSQLARRTAISLYQDGTLNLQTAARLAGLTPDDLKLALHRRGTTPTTAPKSPDRIKLGAD